MHSLAPGAIVRREYWGGLGVLINQGEFELDDKTTSLLRALKHTNNPAQIAHILQAIHDVRVTPADVDRLLDEATRSGFVIKDGAPRQCDVAEVTRQFVDEIADVRDLTFLSAPLNVSIYPGMKCNLSCQFCFVSQEKWDDDNIAYPLEQWIPVLDQIKAMEIPYLTILGGEPLLYPEIWPMLDYLDQIGQKTHITTNGTVVSDRVISELKRHPNITLKVSIQSLDDRHSLLTKGNLHKTLRFIESARSAGIDLGIHTVGLPDTVDQVYPLADYAASHGLNEFSMGVFFNINQVELDEFSLEEYRAMQQRTKEYITEKYGASLGYRLEGCQIWTAEPTIKWEWVPTTPFGILRSGCEAAQARLEIMNDGTLLGCSLFDKHTFGGGNVFEESLKHLWRTAKSFQELRELKTEDHACSQCSYEFFCHGGCPALNYKKTGNLRAGDDRCGIRNQLIQLDAL